MVDEDGVIQTPHQQEYHTNLLVGMVVEHTQQFIDNHYNNKSLGMLSGGVDPWGRELPKQAAALADRLGWREPTPNSRVLKLAQSNGVGVLKGQAWRARLYETIKPHLPPGPTLPGRNESGRVWQAHSQKIAKQALEWDNEPTIRQLLKGSARYYREHGRYPRTLLDAYPTPPRAPRKVDLGVVDKQFATRGLVETPGGGLSLEVRVKLPTGGERGGFSWFSLSFDIPHHARERVREAESVSLPTLILRDSGERIWQTTLSETPPPPRGDPHRVVGVDVNVGKPLTAAIISYDPITDSYSSGGSVFEWDDMGLIAKNQRLQTEQEYLSGKIRAVQTLIDPLPPSNSERARLEAKISVWVRERERVGRKRSRLGVELSHDAATWLRVITRVSGAGGVFVEDLRGLPHTLSPTTNRVLSSTPYARMLEFAKHRLAREGVVVERVNPRGTSSRCPYCLQPLSHPEYAVGECDSCGVREHRDHLSPLRIAQRGHAKHSRPRSRRRSKRARSLDQPIKRVRGPKTGPTPKRVRRLHEAGRSHTRVLARAKPKVFPTRRVFGDIDVATTRGVPAGVGVNARRLSTIRHRT